MIEIGSNLKDVLVSVLSYSFIGYLAYLYFKTK